MFPKEIMEYLKVCREYYPQTLIAGGAIRDYMHDIEPKDYDFYLPRLIGKSTLPLQFMKHYTLQKDLMKALHVRRKELFDEGIIDTPPNQFPKGKRKRSEKSLEDGGFEVIKNDLIDPRIDFIYIDETVESFVRTKFDIGLCECWLDENLDIKFTPAYKFDYENGYLTAQIKPNMTPAQISGMFTKHLPRLHKKFPDHEIKLDHQDLIHKEPEPLFPKAKTKKIHINRRPTNNPQHFKMGTRITVI